MHVTCHISHVTRHISHVIRHTSCITHHTSHFTCHSDRISRHALVAPVVISASESVQLPAPKQFTRAAVAQTSHVTCHMSNAHATAVAALGPAGYHACHNGSDIIGVHRVPASDVSRAPMSLRIKRNKKAAQLSHRTLESSTGSLAAQSFEMTDVTGDSFKLREGRSRATRDEQ
jgi:hypothetical protein